jgi:Fur family transcriptional regulator, peroxide stress response regulator
LKNLLSNPHLQMVNKTAIRILVEKRLKVTPQRIAILDIIFNLNNHPSADNIAEYLRISYPHVPIGTVYKILDVFVDKRIVSRVKTENGTIRYDPIMEKHHHLYGSQSEQIEDFYDEDLNKLLEDYFRKKQIPNFKIEDIKLQIIGKFINNPK